jgi:hypothetical protein
MRVSSTYGIVQSESQRDFVKEVNDWLARDWHLSGGVSTTSYRKDDGEVVIFYTQAILLPWR